jgi:hypothetical protein
MWLDFITDKNIIFYYYHYLKKLQKILLYKISLRNTVEANSKKRMNSISSAYNLPVVQYNTTISRRERER